ncbi:MAG TPA: SAF domain-containing protein [Dermatophilaceae bacterium]|nr:SAF domain-containing protein [Dermatophilaceae bacterium]
MTGWRARAESSAPARVAAALRGPGRRAAWRRHAIRRLATGVVGGAAVWVGLGMVTPHTEESGRTVVTAAVDMPVGHRLRPDDVQARRVGDSGIPSAALTDPQACVGRVTTSMVAAGEVLTAARIQTAAVVAGLGSAHRAIHLPLTDPAAATLVRAGDRVDVIGIADGRIVAADLVVVAVDQQADDGGALALTAAPNSGVVLSVPVSQVGELTRAALGDTPTAGVHLALRPASSLS